MRYTVRHTIEADVDTFWKVYFDPDYNRDLAEDWRDSMKLEVVRAQTDAEGVLHWQVHYALTADIPALARKFMGDGSFAEVGRFEPVERKYIAAWTPNGLETFRTSFEVSAEPLSGQRCERVMKIDGVVKIPGFGPLLERLVAQQQRQAFTRMADFMNRWICGRTG